MITMFGETILRDSIDIKKYTNKQEWTYQIYKLQDIWCVTERWGGGMGGVDQEMRSI